MAASSVKLTADINATVTTVPFDTLVGVVKAGATLTRNGEQMRVTAVDGSNLTVVRGVNGTTAVTHDDDDVLTVVSTVAGNLRLSVPAVTNTTEARHRVSDNLDAIIIQGRSVAIRMGFDADVTADGGEYFYIGAKMPVSFAVHDLAGRDLYFRSDATGTNAVEIMEILRGQA